MENLENVINLLSAVVSTMDTITVVGIDNQDKFVGCALSNHTAKNRILDYIDSAEKEEVTDGNKDG